VGVVPPNLPSWWKYGAGGTTARGFPILFGGAGINIIGCKVYTTTSLASTGVTIGQKPSFWFDPDLRRGHGDLPAFTMASATVTTSIANATTARGFLSSSTAPWNEAIEGSPSSTGYVTWDTDNLYLGARFNVTSTSGTGLVHHFYIGGANGTTTVDSPNGCCAGDTPPFAAKYHIVWDANTGETYEKSIQVRVAGPAWPTTTLTYLSNSTVDPAADNYISYNGNESSSGLAMLRVPLSYMPGLTSAPFQMVGFVKARSGGGSQKIPALSPAPAPDWMATYGSALILPPVSAPKSGPAGGAVRGIFGWFLQAAH
jgi:hypothetical protein